MDGVGVSWGRMVVDTGAWAVKMSGQGHLTRFSEKHSIHVAFSTGKEASVLNELLTLVFAISYAEGNRASTAELPNTSSHFKRRGVLGVSAAVSCGVTMA